jgi:hypothetical protein
MELQGRMDENGQIWVTLTVRGTRSETTIEAVVDTGFTHPLLLPVAIAVPLGLELVDFAPMELAGGCKTFSPLLSPLSLVTMNFRPFASLRKRGRLCLGHCSCNRLEQPSLPVLLKML